MEGVKTDDDELSFLFLLLYDVLPNMGDHQILQNLFMKGCHPKPEYFNFPK